jgi:hypothetical protein
MSQPEPPTGPFRPTSPTVPGAGEASPDLPALIGRSRVEGVSPSRLFPAPSQVQKNGDQETLKHRPHKKEDDRAYRDGG